MSEKELPPSVVGNAALRELEGELKRVKRELAIAQEERTSQKMHRRVHTGTAMKYAFIERERTNHAVTVLCRVVPVSGSAYYRWRQR